MAEHKQPDEGESLHAPARLVTALQQSERRVLLVPPHIDEAALSRPRLHLRRIRQRLGAGKAPRAPGVEELALAARAPEAGSARPTFDSGGEPASRPRQTGWPVAWKIALWVFLVAAVAGALLLWAYWQPHH